MATEKMLGCKDRPDLDALVHKAVAEFDTLSPEQKREHRKKQRRSWVIGEMMLEHPEMTYVEAERVYEEICLGR